MSTFPELELPPPARRGKDKNQISPEELRRAQLTVARNSSGDPGLCAELLKMLGLAPGRMAFTVETP